MRSQGLVTAEDVEAAEAERLPRKVRLPGSQGPEEHFVEYVKQQLIPYYGRDEVYGGGLRVKTTLDLRLQEVAREAIEKWLPARERARRPRSSRSTRATAACSPWSSGQSFRKSQFNLAVQGQRQSGSAFKPFVLAAALEEGIAPETSFVSEPTLINLGDKLWSVANYEGSYLGTIDLVEGDDVLRQRRLRAAHRPGRADERGEDRARPRHHEPPARVLRDRARRRGGQPARDGACLLDLRQRRRAARRERARRPAAARSSGSRATAKASTGRRPRRTAHGVD